MQQAAYALETEERVTITVRLDDELWRYLTTWADGHCTYHPMPLYDAP